jgi:hypothetical protein
VGNESFVVVVVMESVVGREIVVALTCVVRGVVIIRPSARWMCGRAVCEPWGPMGSKLRSQSQSQLQCVRASIVDIVDV